MVANNIPNINPPKWAFQPTPGMKLNDKLISIVTIKDLLPSTAEIPPSINEPCRKVIIAD